MIAHHIEVFLTDDDRWSLIERAYAVCRRTGGAPYHALVNALSRELATCSLDPLLDAAWTRLIGALWLNDGGAFGAAYASLAVIFSFGNFDSADIPPALIARWRNELAPFRHVAAHAILDCAESDTPDEALVEAEAVARAAIAARQAASGAAIAEVVIGGRLQ